MKEQKKIKRTGPKRDQVDQNGGTLLEAFHQHRTSLFAIAYRMLGSVMDAEDMVQETFLRWQKAPVQTIQSSKAYLTTIITRLCIDHLRSAQVQREQYVGPWLPEPIVTNWSTDPVARAELSDSLSMAFLILLERLSPLERAVFLLREVFDYEYGEIGPMVGKTPTNCRQIARRARQHVSLEKSRFQTTPQQQERLTQQFMQAFSQGNVQAFLDMLAEDVTLWSDGGGKVVAALKPLHGAQKIARFLRAIHRRGQKTGWVPQLRLAQVNGQPGLVFEIEERIESVMTLDEANGRIQTLYFIRNPEKLER